MHTQPPVIGARHRVLSLVIITAAFICLSMGFYNFTTLYLNFEQCEVRLC